MIPPYPTHTGVSYHSLPEHFTLTSHDPSLSHSHWSSLPSFLHGSSLHMPIPQQKSLHPSFSAHFTWAISTCLLLSTFSEKSALSLLSSENPLIIGSVQFSHSVVSDSLQPHELQHVRSPCPSPTPRVHPNPCPSSRWCHPTISFSVIPFSSCPQSVPVSGSFQMSQLFTSGGQSTGVSASISVLPMNTQDWSPLVWTGWISLQSKGLSRVFSKPQFKSINSSALSFLYSPTLTSVHNYWKNHSLD